MNMNTTSILNRARATRSKQMRFNPLGNLDISSMSRSLDRFEAGYLRDAANIWDHLEQRDDLIRAVVSKRKKSVARQGYTVVINNDLPDTQKAEAREHAAALEFFYRNLECENAIDSCEKGGFKLLIRQMMDAVGKRFAIHEIIWNRVARPSSAAGSEASRLGSPLLGGEGQGEGELKDLPGENFGLSASFRFVPLTFFENTTGQPRFLENESLLEGKPLEPGAWMITVADGLMMATAT